MLKLINWSYSEGLKDINELKEAYKDKIVELRKNAAVEIPTVDPEAAAAEAAEANATNASSPFPAPPAAPKPQPSVKKVSGIKTLDDYVDLTKIRELPQKEIEVLWRLRHAHNPQSLCAVIPLDAYKVLEESGKKFPHFVLPIDRKSVV